MFTWKLVVRWMTIHRYTILVFDQPHMPTQPSHPSEDSKQLLISHSLKLSVNTKIHFRTLVSTFHTYAEYGNLIFNRKIYKHTDRVLHDLLLVTAAERIQHQWVEVESDWREGLDNTAASESQHPTRHIQNTTLTCYNYRLPKHLFTIKICMEVLPQETPQVR